MVNPYPIRLKESAWTRLKERSDQKGVPVIKQIRQAVDNYLETQDDMMRADDNQSVRLEESLRKVLLELGPLVFRASELKDHPSRKAGDKAGQIQFLKPVITDENRALVPLRMLAEPPCGPWKEALESADVFYLSREMATAIGVKEHDFLVRATGQSMEAAGIPDGAILLMRPLNGADPEPGSVALIQVRTHDDKWLGTVKHWFRSQVGNADLRDGRGMPYYPPPNTKDIIAVAVKVGMIASG